MAVLRNEAKRGEADGLKKRTQGLVRVPKDKGHWVGLKKRTQWFVAPHGPSGGAWRATPQGDGGGVENTNPMALVLSGCATKPMAAHGATPQEDGACWAIRADENGWPKRHDWHSRKTAILSCQSTVVRRFEHLAARKNRHLWAPKAGSKIACPGNEPNSTDEGKTVKWLMFQPIRTRK
jgi:hypothetical protein